MPDPKRRFSRRRSLKEILRTRKFGLRLFVIFILLVFLAAFFHFREIRIDTLEKDKVAARYVVAQVDFTFPDPDATMLLKQEAIRDVGNIYCLIENEVRQACHRFESYLIHRPDWRNESQATFEEMYNALDAVKKELSTACLTDARTCQKGVEIGLKQENYYSICNGEFCDLSLVPESFWQKVFDRINRTGRFSENTIQYVIDFLKQESWNIYNDVDSQRLFKQSVEDEIGEKYTKVLAGSKIIEEGERVTPRHLAMMSAMKHQMAESRNLWQVGTILGSILFAVIVVLLGSFYFTLNHKAFARSIRQLSLFVTIVISSLILVKIAEWLLLRNNHQLIELVHYPIFVPFATILLCVLLGKEIALFTTFFLTIIFGMTLVVDENYFLFINMITAVAALLFARSMKKRKEIFFVAAKVWLSAIPVILAFNLINGNFLSVTTITDILTSGLCLLIIAILLIGYMPILESIFNVMTDITLMEYLDPTNDLLRRLSMECPGTFHHSFIIGNLAEMAANAIGANGLFCRVACMYHDIGKLPTPHYYTENQQTDLKDPFNIHLLLTPQESCAIIRGHVPEGVNLAEQYKLPEPFINAIREHHGTTLIKYFYFKQIEEVGGNKEDVDEMAFRYQGPKPQSKETAIIMIADSVEATSRSLDDNSEESIRNMVEDIVSDRIQDGQFDECPLSFEELYVVKNKFVEMLRASSHLRIKYPKPKDNEKER